MTDIVPATPAALVGDVMLSEAHYATAGDDLDYALAACDMADPFDAETDTSEASPADWAAHRALNYVRDRIAVRRAVQAGPSAVGDYCGLSGDRGRACGADLGLPDCRYHRVCDTCGHNGETGGVDHYRDHEGGVCPTRALDGGGA